MVVTHDSLESNNLRGFWITMTNTLVNYEAIYVSTRDKHLKISLVENFENPLLEIKWIEIIACEKKLLFG